MENEIALFSFKEADGVALGIHLGDSTVMRGYVSTSVLPLQNMLYTEVTADEVMAALSELDVGKTVSVSSCNDIFSDVHKSQGAAIALEKFISDNIREKYIITIPIELNNIKDVVISDVKSNATMILGALCKLENSSSLNLNQDKIKLILGGIELDQPCSRCNLASRKINGICIYDCGLEMCLNSLDADDPTVEQRLNALGFKSVTIDEEVQLCLT